MSRTWSLPEIYKDMGIEVSAEVSWKLGNEVRDEWERVKGYPPERELRPKSKGGGTHVLAVYPEEWLPRIKKRISYYKHGQLPQMKLDL